MPMGTKLNDTLCQFIKRQHVFFVATAAPDGRVNLSPKGADTLRVLDHHRLRWLNPPLTFLPAWGASPVSL